MLKRKATVKSNTEKAQGLTLSRSAEVIINGSNHLPPSLHVQSVAVTALPERSNSTAAIRTAASDKSVIILLFIISYGVTLAEKRNSRGKPASFSRETMRSILPTPAGPCAVGSKVTSTSVD